MKYGVVSNCGSGNLGDDIMFRTMQQLAPAVEFSRIPLAQAPDATRGCVKSNWDRMIVGGGDLVSPSTYYRGNWDRVNEPFQVFGAGVALDNPAQEFAVDKYAERLKRVTRIIARDAESATWLQRVSGCDNVGHAADIAWAYEPELECSPMQGVLALVGPLVDCERRAEEVADAAKKIGIEPVWIVGNTDEVSGDYRRTTKLAIDRGEQYITGLPEYRWAAIRAAQFVWSWKFHGWIAGLSSPGTAVYDIDRHAGAALQHQLDLPGWMYPRGVRRVGETLDAMIDNYAVGKAGCVFASIVRADAMVVYSDALSMFPHC
ncbi:MAG TPA: polysaccharide pyruvyl transferase family protein [Anaerolineae bacterium]|nr:polysaccharide pyruvyl transferase family protein [Anaerolineae bacterium]